MARDMTKAEEKLQGRPCSVGDFSRPGQFQIIRDLHSSPTGSVHLAKIKAPTSSVSEVVLKKRKVPELGKAKDMLNEFEVMKKLSHPNIIRCYGYFWDYPSQSLYIVLEYANRGDLHSELQNRKRLGKHFGNDEVWGILAQVLLGLRHIHARGIVHRDVKTMNLLLNDQGVIKLGDFGVSRQMSEHTMQLQSFYGTPLYLSPELIEGRPYTQSTDLWSLGVVLYELLSLELPFKGNNLQDIVSQVLSGRYAPLPAFRGAELAEAVQSLLTRDMRQRPSAEMLLQRLEKLGKIRRQKVEELPKKVETPPDKENRSPPSEEQVVRVRRRPTSAPQVRPKVQTPYPGDLVPPDDAGNGGVKPAAGRREERWEQRRQAHVPQLYAKEKLQGRPSSVGDFTHREQFQILKDLQSNSNGSVHLAKALGAAAQAVVAPVLVLKRRKVPELGKAKDMLNEYEVMKKLNHPNIIRCHGYFWDFQSQSLYIVLEYANRGDLHSELQSRRRLGKHFGDDEVWDILAQVLLGLRHIHARGIVHRDIKSMNLFLTDEGVIKLGDFGVSRQMSEKTMCLHSFYGTPLYFSPEIIEGRPYSHSTDLWSLGVVLYELLSLELPFKGPSLQDVIAAVLRGQYAPLSRPAEFNQVVSMLLTRDAEKRPNAEELLRRLGRMGRLRRAEHWSPAGKPVEPEKTPEGDVLVRVRRASRESRESRESSDREAKSDPKSAQLLAKVAPRHAELFAALPGPAAPNGNAREERYERRRQAHFRSSSQTEASKSSNDSEDTAPNVLLAPPGLTRAVPKRLAS